MNRYFPIFQRQKKKKFYLKCYIGCQKVAVQESQKVTQRKDKAQGGTSNKLK